MSYVTLVITGGPELDPVPFTSGMNAQQVLEAAYNALVPNPPVTDLTYSLEFYGTSQTPPDSPLGYLVSTINGTSDSANAAQSPYYFWEFLVNGTPQNTGIDYTEIFVNDEVTFSFVTYDAELHAGTTLEAKYKRRLALAK